MLLANVALSSAQRGVGRHGGQNTLKPQQEHLMLFCNVTQTIHTHIIRKLASKYGLIVVYLIVYLLTIGAMADTLSKKEEARATQDI